MLETVPAILDFALRQARRNVNHGSPPSKRYWGQKVITDLDRATREAITQLADAAVLAIDSKESRVSHTLYDIRVTHEGRRGGGSSSK
jgi:hypothetical protein